MASLRTFTLSDGSKILAKTKRQVMAHLPKSSKVIIVSTDHKRI